MAEINSIIYAIIALFFVLLTIKSILKSRLKKLCVICASISLTWIVLLILNWSGKFSNTLIISLLMGMSVTGVYYLIEKNIGKTNKKLLVFRLPIILTLIIIAYYLLTFESIVSVLLVVAVLWLLFAVIYLYKNTKFAKRLLECCKQ